MSSSPVFVLHWGIIATGKISSEFVKDLVLPPSGRSVSDIAHAVVAVGSRSVLKAQDFIEKFCPDGASAQVAGLTEKRKAVAYGSYAEVYADEVSLHHAFPFFSFYLCVFFLFLGFLLMNFLKKN